MSLERFFREPPFRLVAKSAFKLAHRLSQYRGLKWLAPSIRQRCDWEVSNRPCYLLGLLEAAAQAKKQGVKRISAIEFGVAGGDGLCFLQEEAEAVTRATGIEIEVYGFDRGAAGMPEGTCDYRDHPDLWQPGDFPMDEDALKRRLKASTTLVLGNIAETAPRFHERMPAPLGFVSVDVDHYSASAPALKVFDSAPMIANCIMHFDDTEFLNCHQWAGEFLAINEFNAVHEHIKIDRWYGVKNGKPFPERSYYERMWVAHDLLAITAMAKKRTREAKILPLHAQTA